MEEKNVEFMNGDEMKRNMIGYGINPGNSNSEGNDDEDDDNERFFEVSQEKTHKKRVDKGKKKDDEDK